MFGKLMNRYYYGKSGQGDYTKEDLPQTRMQLFKEMLRVRFASLFKLNLIYMIGWIPAMFVIGRGIVMGLNALNSFATLEGQLEAGEITAEYLGEVSAVLPQYLQSILSQTLLFLIPCMAIAGIFTPGAALITRNWARDEHAFVFSDFMDAVKANWKYGLLTGFITGAVLFLLYVCVTFYSGMAKSNMLFVIPEVLCIVVAVLWLCSLMYIYPQMVTYTLNYKGLVKNSLIMTISRMPATIGLKLLSLLPAVILAVFSFLTPYAIIALLVYLVYYVVLGFALSRFVGASYSNGVFDAYLNPHIEGAEVNKGLYLDDEDEDEDAEAIEEEQPAALNDGSEEK